DTRCQPWARRNARRSRLVRPHSAQRRASESVFLLAALPSVVVIRGLCLVMSFLSVGRWGRLREARRSVVAGPPPSLGASPWVGAPGAGGRGPRPGAPSRGGPPRTPRGAAGRGGGGSPGGPGPRRPSPVPPGGGAEAAPPGPPPQPLPCRSSTPEGGGGGIPP